MSNAIQVPSFNSDVVYLRVFVLLNFSEMFSTDYFTFTCIRYNMIFHSPVSSLPLRIIIDCEFCDIKINFKVQSIVHGDQLKITWLLTGDIQYLSINTKYNELTNV